MNFREKKIDFFKTFKFAAILVHHFAPVFSWFRMSFDVD